MIVTRLREEKEPQVNQDNTLNAEVGNLKGDRAHCRQRAHMRSPHTCDPDPCRYGETHTVPTPYTLGPHIHTHQGDPPPQTPPPGSHVHSPRVTSPPQTLHLGSHVPLVRTPWLCRGLPQCGNKLGPWDLLGWEKVSGGSPFPTLVPEESSSSHFGSV